LRQHVYSHSYRLLLKEGNVGQEREVEFEAESAAAALSLIYQFCRARAATLFEDGEKMADLKYAHGFWEVS
jgi:hypothetical protein